MEVISDILLIGIRWINDTIFIYVSEYTTVARNLYYGIKLI